MIYLDNAATTFPKPECVINAMTSVQKKIGANAGRGGHKQTMLAGEIVYLARNKISKMFGANTERVIFTNNCTMSLNMAIKGCAGKSGHIVISSLEHNSVLRPVEKLKSTGNFTYSVFKVNPKNENETLSNLNAEIQENTKMVICTFASNVFGTVIPIKRIGNMLHNRNIIFIVDAAQAAGTFKIDMKEMKIDLLCMPGHKGLYGPMGTGILILGNNIDIDTLFEGGTGSFSMESTQPEIYPDKLESGTVNLIGIAGLSAGIDFINKLGGENKLREHETHLTQLLFNDLKSNEKIEIYDNMYSKIMSPILSFNVKNEHSEKIAQKLDKCNIAVRGGYHCSFLAHHYHATEEIGAVRVSVGAFNTKNDIKFFTFSLNKIANS